jgi:hypothetical protein
MSNIDLLQQHELSWLFLDAMDLLQHGRQYSALLLLLCTVDALAARAYPKAKVGDRFKDYLKAKLPAHTRIQTINIRVPKREQVLPLEYILYKYLRNPMVHEGAHLDVDKPSHFEVSIDWSKEAASIKIDDDRNQVVLGGVFIVNILSGIVTDGLIEDIAKR